MLSVLCLVSYEKLCFSYFLIFSISLGKLLFSLLLNGIQLFLPNCIKTNYFHYLVGLGALWSDKHTNMAT